MNRPGKGSGPGGGGYNAGRNYPRAADHNPRHNAPQDRFNNQRPGNFQHTHGNLSMRSDSTAQARQTSGKMLTNHFIIDTAKIDELFQYSVQISRVVSPGTASSNPTGDLRRRIIYLFIRQLYASGSLVGIKIGSDYKNFLVTVKQLPHTVRTMAHTLSYYKEDENGPPANGPQYIINITDETRLSLSCMRDFLNNRPGGVNSTFAARNATLRCLNIIFSHGANLYSFIDLRRSHDQKQVTNIGSKKYYDLDLTRPPTQNNAPWDIPTQPGLEALPGFFLSVRAPMGGDFLLNLNTTTSAFYGPGSLWNLIRRNQHMTLNPPLQSSRRKQ